MSKIFAKSKWIWAEESTEKSDSVIIVRKSFQLDKPPKTALCRIAAENKYYLNVNGKMAVFDGGLLRVSRPGQGYYDETDIAKLLVKGENVISAVVIYYGSTANNNVSAGRPGFLFECAELGIYSDMSFTVFKDKAFVASSNSPTVFSAGVTLKYDATLENTLTGYQKADFVSNIFVPATEYGEYGSRPWGELLKRPTPLYADKLVEKARKVEKKTNVLFGDRYADVYTVPLPSATFAYPRFVVNASSGDKIEIRSDRFLSNGVYDDEEKTYRNFTLEYICKAESQEFEFPQCLHGEKLIFAVTPGMKVNALGYRESVYGSEENGYFRSNSEYVGRLYDKCANTLLNCMRDTFIDAPERGNTMTLAPAAVGAACACYMSSDGGVPLLEKTMSDLLDYVENDVLYSNVYGTKKEIPSQTLIALSEFGIAERYYALKGKSALLKDFILAALRYLAKWEMGDDGLVARRRGDAVESDKLFNNDKKLIINMLYYSALESVRKLSEKCGDSSQSGFLKDRAISIAEALEKKYDGVGYTSGGGFYDERANAFAVLCGIADKDRYEGIVSILESVQCATPLYEGYVLEALCRMGRGDIAYRRMCSRYHNLVENDNSTLCEDFSERGAKCYLGSMAPLYIMYRYFAGLEIAEGMSKITLTPDIRMFSAIEFGCETDGGFIKGKVSRGNAHTEIIIENGTATEITLVLKSDYLGIAPAPDKVVKLGKGKTKMAL